MARDAVPLAPVPGAAARGTWLALPGPEEISMRGGIVAGLVIAGLLCALAGPGPLPAPGVRIGPDDVVVEDWQTGPLGQMGVPAGWEGQTWGKTSAFAL